MSSRIRSRISGRLFPATGRMKYAAVVVLLALAAGCGGIRKLERTDTEVNLNLPSRPQSEMERERIADSLARNRTSPERIVTYRKQDGTVLYFAPTTLDSLTGEQMISFEIEQITVTASSRRNVAERNGWINLEFLVTVPAELQDKKWRLLLEPRLLKGPDTLALDPLVVSGDRFRRLQSRQYARYGDYVGRIVDSADYFRAFGDRRAFLRRLEQIEAQRNKYAEYEARLSAMTVEEALTDPDVGMFGRREYRRLLGDLQRYVRRMDRLIARRTLYRRSTAGKYDYLEDYFAPRYRYAGQPLAAPGGVVYTRVAGVYPDGEEQRREAFFQGVADSLADVRERGAGKERMRDYDFLSRAVEERMQYTGLGDERLTGIILQLGDSSRNESYRLLRDYLASQLEGLSRVDTLELMRRYCDRSRIDRNRRLDERKDAVFTRRVRYPYVEGARLDTVIYLPDKIRYRYVDRIQADEHTARLYLCLAGRVHDFADREYVLKRSDTLTFSVASMTAFVDETPRYVQRIVTRDAEANARFYFVFPKGKSRLEEDRPENRSQIEAVRTLTRALMTDPVFIIDSITLRATSSPEGSWRVNDRLARERASAVKEVLVSEFRVLYDSLRIASGYTLDERGNTVRSEAAEQLPDLPDLLHTAWLAEDWSRLGNLIEADTVLDECERLLEIIRTVGDPDLRERRIRSRFPKAYAYMLSTLYPKMRAVDFRFNLHRRGMKQDTVYTTELDSVYMRGRELLRKRNYEQALDMLRPYEDRNTALAYMSLGYDAAAARILRGLPGQDKDAAANYLLAILAGRQGDEQLAVQYYLRSVELEPRLRFRGNLDPEISHLIRKYQLFSEE